MKTIETDYKFADRMKSIPVSFIREILKITSQPDVISFAGGLPNPDYFPVKALEEAATKILSTDGRNVLQYAVSEGFFPLRQYISDRYLKSGLRISPEEILITNGSQQGLDLAGKVFIDPGDRILMEAPGYLGAIQCFSAYQPQFLTVDLLEDGIDIKLYSQILKREPIKLFYSVPNFQNPTGITYSMEKRIEVARQAELYNTIIVEDNPYGEIRFEGESLPPIKKFLPDQTILLGSFSKIISPGMRLGWVAADKRIIEKMILAKQATDLHSNFLSQRIIYQFLIDNDLDAHISKIKSAYKKQKDLMLEMIGNYFPKGVKVTQPEGGMFLWITLPKGIDTYAMLEDAAKEKVVFVPGKAFYIKNGGANTMRINFSNTNAADIEKGISILGKILNKFL